MLSIIPQPKSIRYLDNESFKLEGYPRVRLILKTEDERLFYAVNSIFPCFKPLLEIDANCDGYILTIDLDKSFIPGKRLFL